MVEWKNSLSNYEEKSVAAPFVYLMERLKAVEREFLYLLSVVDSTNVAVIMLTSQSRKLISVEWCRGND